MVRRCPTWTSWCSHPGPDKRFRPTSPTSAIPAEEFEELKKLEQSGKARLFELGPGLDADALWFAPFAARREGGPAVAHERGASPGHLDRGEPPRILQAGVLRRVRSGGRVR